MADQDPHETDVYAPARTRTQKFVSLQSDAGVARLQLNHPPANVLSIEMMEEIVAALESLEYARDVKLLVIGSTGKYFSYGFELQDHIGDRGYVMLDTFRRIVESLHKIDKPVLAVVAGPAYGAGLVLAVACDMVLAGTSAKFALPEIKGGVFNTVGAALLPRIVGRKRAFEMILGGGSIAAAEAERIGLVTRVVPDERLETEVTALEKRFQEASAPVVQLTRRAVAGGLELLFDDALKHAEDVYLNQLMATEDAQEGLAAFMAKRKPVWKDK